MYYSVSILLIITGLLLAIFGVKKYNISLSLSFIIIYSAFLYYIDDLLSGFAYVEYGYYAIIFFGILILLLAKIFTYLYAYFNLSLLFALILASLYAAIDAEPGAVSGWIVLGSALVTLIIIRKSIKKIVIGMGSGYMLGIGIAAIGFRSIIKMGWSYFIDAIMLPSLVILLFTIAGIAYQFYLDKATTKPEAMSKKQVNLYFGGGSGVLAFLVMILPLFLVVSPKESANKMAIAYCECIDGAQTKSYDEISDECKEAIDFSEAIGRFTSLEDINTFNKAYLEGISQCLPDSLRQRHPENKLNENAGEPSIGHRSTESNPNDSILRKCEEALEAYEKAVNAYIKVEKELKTNQNPPLELIGQSTRLSLIVFDLEKGLERKCLINANLKNRYQEAKDKVEAFENNNDSEVEASKETDSVSSEGQVDYSLFQTMATIISGKWEGSFGDKILALQLQADSTGHIEGTSTVGENTRPISGTFKGELAYIEVTLNEPGDDKWDGVFEIEFTPNKSLYEGFGNWKANNGKLARDFTIQKNN